MKEKKCWHRWDKFIASTRVDFFHIHYRKTKVCRKCGETRIKEKVW